MLVELISFPYPPVPHLLLVLRSRFQCGYITWGLNSRDGQLQTWPWAYAWKGLQHPRTKPRGHTTSVPVPSGDASRCLDVHFPLGDHTVALLSLHSSAIDGHCSVVRTVNSGLRPVQGERSGGAGWTVYDPVCLSPGVSPGLVFLLQEPPRVYLSSAPS